MKRIMSVDLEPAGGLDNCKSIELVLPKLLDLFDDYKIKATFFVVTKLLDNYGSEIKELSKKHEIASHSHTHNNLTSANAEYEVKTSIQKLKEHKIKCIGFRSPRFITTKSQFSLLKKYGYKYDSSIATFFPGRYSNLFTSKNPYAKDGLIELPIPTFVYPFINSGLSYLKLFHPLSTVFPKTYMFYLHPWEFLEKKDLPKSSHLSLISSLSKINSGNKAWSIFQDYIERSNCKFVSFEEYIKVKFPDLF